MFSLLKAATAKSASLSSSSPTMGRIKAPPISAHPDSSQEKPTVDVADSVSEPSSANASMSSSQPIPQSSTSITSSPASTCPHCKKAMYEVSIDDFRDHVASCTRPSTADDGSDSSELTELHDSEFSPARSNLIAQPKENPFGVEEDDVPTPTPFEFDVKEPEPSADAIMNKGASKKNALRKFEYGTQVRGPRAYVNPETKFDFYNETDGHQQIENDPEDPENAMKFRFPQLSNVEEFSKYLEDPDEMPELELYKKTANVSEVLKLIQDEYDVIEKEVNAHEAYLKEQQEQAIIRAKELEAEHKASVKEAEKQAAERRRRNLHNHFKQQGPGAYRAALERKDPLAIELESAVELQEQPPKDKKVIKPVYAYAPIPEDKMTKEEIEIEKRKRGRLMTHEKFNDMKTADVYGFEYNAHVKYIGAQPLSSASTKRRGANGTDNTETGRLRNTRQPTRKFYEETSPGSDSEGLPTKRVRKVRNLDDGGENAGRSRPTSHSRGGTPAPRTFPSGKKVGRPSKADVLARSKLSNSMVAPTSETPETSQENGTAEDSRGEQKLAGDVQEDLQSAAAGVINTITNKVAPETSTIAVGKPKNKGGRPRKNKANEVLAAPPKKNKGGRPRKHPLPEETNAEEVEAPAKRRRVKQEQAHENIMSFGDENGVLQSTEEYDREQGQMTEPSSRPTTSSSNITASSFGSRRSARPQTQAKTEAREQKELAQNLKKQAKAESKATLGPTKRKRNEDDPQEILEDNTTGRGKRNKIAHQPFDPSSSAEAEAAAAKSTRGKKRARGFDEIEQSVDAANGLVTAPNKKRTARSAKDDVYGIPADDEDLDEEGGPRKRIRGESASNAIAGPSTETTSMTPSTDPALPATKSRTKYAKAKPVEVSVEDWVPDIRSDDGRHLSEITDAHEREEVRKRRVKRGKSDKLSASMHARWNDGRMTEAMQTRKANAERKKIQGATVGQPGPKPIPSSSTAPASASGSGPIANPFQENTATSTTTANATAAGKGKRKASSTSKNKGPAYNEDEDEAVFQDDSSPSSSEDPAPTVATASAHAVPPPIQTRRTSSRARTKPKRIGGGFDGADDEEEEDEEVQQQFKSEYDRYQALSSPGARISLGKRATRKAMNFAENLGGDSDDDDFFM